MESKSFTQDGSVDLRGRPVIASGTGRWRACAFLVGYEAFERMAFYGVASNLVVYLTTQLHEDTVSSVRSVNNWSGSVWITPIIGAYIADTYIGRFWTFTIASLIYVMGMVLLTMAVSLESLRPTCNNGICSKASHSQIAFFYSSLYIIAIGAGGTKPNISTFGADHVMAGERAKAPSNLERFLNQSHMPGRILDKSTGSLHADSAADEAGYPVMERRSKRKKLANKRWGEFISG